MIPPAPRPKVIPARFPNLLVNGAGGIAVGMATNIPPHNLVEVVNACVAIMDNPAIDLIELMSIMPGPDFPTSGIILGQAGIRQAYETGRGSVIMRGRVHVEPMRNDREAIIITEVPYQVNKATMIEKMADLVREKRIEGISDLRDESDRQGYRVVIELKRDAVADVIIKPALPLHAAAVLVRGQHGGAQWRPTRADEPHRHAQGLRGVPRGRDHAAHQIPAAQVARAGACFWSVSPSRSPISTK